MNSQSRRPDTRGRRRRRRPTPAPPTTSPRPSSCRRSTSPCPLAARCSSRASPAPARRCSPRASPRASSKPLHRWNIKSTTKAQDGLYVYDTVQRLYDGRFGDGDVSDIAPLHQARHAGRGLHRRASACVLLIDEIDKADIEFPNDLLCELDQMEFTIPETRETIKATQRPDRDHHVQHREGAARRLPAPLRLPLHRVPRRGA